MKVTDKRMFTADGELREEYRSLVDAAPIAAPAPPDPVAPSPATSPAPAPVMYGDESARLELPGTPPGLGRPSFLDLVSLLAEPIALYLGDLPLPDGSSAENLEMARPHIDLLDVLREKTAGNLSVQESAFLEDMLYQSRVRYVQLRG